MAGHSQVGVFEATVSIIDSDKVSFLFLLINHLGHFCSLLIM